MINVYLSLSCTRLISDCRPRSRQYTDREVITRYVQEERIINMALYGIFGQHANSVTVTNIERHAFLNRTHRNKPVTVIDNLDI